MLGIILGSALLCLLPACRGLLRQRRGVPACAAEDLHPGFPQPFDRAIACIYAAMVLSFAAGTAISPPASAPGHVTLDAALSTLAFQLGLYLPLLLRYATLPRTQWARPSWKQCLLWPLLALAAIYIGIESLELAGFYNWLIETTGCPAQQTVVTQFVESGDPLLRATLTFSAIVLAPVTEECCFRGFLYSTLRHWGGRAAATIASAAVFAAVHVSLAQFIPLFIFGVVMCLAYEKARSLWLPMVTHGLFNALTLLSLLLAS